MYGDREIWLSTWLAPVSDGQGGVKAVLGVSRDLTDQKRAEEELRNAQKLEASDASPAASRTISITT